MPRPIWTTPSQFISLLREGDYFRFEFRAENAVRYQLISGSLPPGIQLVTKPSPQGFGSIEGTPTITDINPVDKIYNYSFAVRAFSSDNQISDRGFSLSVNTIKQPNIISPAADLGLFSEGSKVDIQITAIDFTPNDELTFSLKSGTLPAGISLSSSGRISGYIYRLLLTDPEIKTFDFVVEVSDGTNKNLKNYSIRAKKNAITDLPPVILTDPAELTSAEHDNFFSFKFTGYDFDGDPISYFIANNNIDLSNQQETGFDTAGFDDFVFDQITSEIPNTLTLDPETGWLHGRLPSLVEPNIYRFYVGVKKAVAPFTTGDIIEFDLYVYPGNLSIRWVTPSKLEDLFNGMVSDLSVEARLASNTQVWYRILPYNVSDPKLIRLPQGIRLTESGLLIGRASFRCFSLDGGTTTVSDTDITTYDETYTFTVQARNAEDINAATITSTKTFTVRVRNRNPVPYENIYIQAIPDLNNRLLYQNLINDTSWTDNNGKSIIYRSEDPYFGRAQDLKILFMPGVEAPLLSEYFSSELLNHYRKEIKLDTIDYAVATDQNFNPVYEVIYATLKDDLANEQDQSVAMEIDLLGKIANYYKIDNVSQTKIYPNSYFNMRTRLLENLELENKGVLPRWMTSVQPDGSVPGPINVIPLAYVKPGTASAAIQRLNDKIKNNLTIKNLNSFNFTIDRYQIDRHLSKYWDFNNNKFFDSDETVFDRFINDTIGLTLVDTVDYALSVPFDTINGAEVKNLLGYTDIRVLNPQVFPVDHPSWSVWMNQNAVWVNNKTNALPNSTQTIERDFNVDVSTTYNVVVMNTDSVSVFIDDILIKTINGFNVVSDINNTFTPTFLSAGSHVIKIVTSTGAGSIVWNANPTGVAVSIVKDSITVFNTVRDYEPRVTFNTLSLKPGLDGVSDFKDGDKLVFAKQDFYPNYTGENHGWNLFSDPYGIKFDPLLNLGSFNQYSVVPGLRENSYDILAKQLDPGAPTPRINERAGIWTVNISNGRITLLFDKEVKKSQIVRVRRGQTYGGATLVLANDPTPVGSTELNYIRINTRSSNGITVFDGGSTRFFDYRDLYVDPGRGDKYVIYPKLGVFE